ncbi:MAG TPA: sigma-70 family RNA polymerase sigma factor [Vicinamibacteria bacterium]|nr:sigma-70 family RNA polymerase sigma factor [Vicinamibacteria bacterium]
MSTAIGTAGDLRLRSGEQVSRPAPATLSRTSEGFETEALPHLRSLYAAACRMTGNAHDAEDLVQETCLRAYRAFDGYTPGTNIRAWLFTILHRVRTDSFRRAFRAPHTVELPERGIPVPPPQDALATGGEEVLRALNRLAEPFRTAVVLRDVQDFTYEEIAQTLRVPIGTVMSRIHRGRAQLRQALSARRPS